LDYEWPRYPELPTPADPADCQVDGLVDYLLHRAPDDIPMAVQEFLARSALPRYRFDPDEDMGIPPRHLPLPSALGNQRSNMGLTLPDQGMHQLGVRMDIIGEAPDPSAVDPD
jgi:hypothetical protein